MDVWSVYYLILLSCISFGGHYARSSLSMFGLYMINDSFTTPAGMGLLLSACALPSMFIPLIVGHSVDNTKREIFITVTLFFFEICGLALFCFAVIQRSFSGSIAALLLFGVGTSSISVIQRVLVTLFLKDDISFTTGFYVALANGAKLLGKITVAPSTEAFHSYQVALVLPALACILSLLFYLLFHATNEHGTIYINYVATTTRGRSNTEIELSIRKGTVGGIIPESLDEYSPPPHSYSAAQNPHSPLSFISSMVPISPISTNGECSPLMSSADAATTPPRSVYQSTGVSGTLLPSGLGGQIGFKSRSSSPVPVSVPSPAAAISPRAGQTAQIDLPWLPTSIIALPWAFYWLAGVHTIYILIFHALVNFMPHLVYSTYHTTSAEAGYVSSLPYIVTILLAPWIGLLADRLGMRMHFCAAAGLLTVISYTVLVYTDANPYLKVALISLPHGFITVLVLAEISVVLPASSVGIAFGIIEVLDSIVNVFGNILFGFLYNFTGSYRAGIIVLMLFAWVGLAALVCMVVFDISPSSAGYSEILSSADCCEDRHKRDRYSTSGEAIL